MGSVFVISEVLLFLIYVTASMGMFAVYLGVQPLIKYIQEREKHKTVLDFLAICVFCFLGIVNEMPVFTVFIPLLSTFFIYMSQKGRSLQFNVKLLVTTVILIVYELFGTYHLYLLSVKNVQYDEIQISVMCMLFTLLIQIFMIHVENAFRFRKEHWGKYYLVGLVRSILIGTWVYGVFREVDSYNLMLLLFWMLWIIVILEFYLFYYFDKIRLYEIETEQRIKSPVNRDEYYIAMEEEHLKIRRMYHDMQNQLMILRESMENNTENMAGYMSETEDMLKGMEQFYHTGNQQLDIFLYESEKRAKEKGISFHATIQEHCLDFMSGSNIKAIFVNAVANAIEACEKIEDGEKKIEIMAGSHLNDVILSFVNTKKPQSNRKDLKTTKENKRNHGIGLTSIQRAVDDYDGFMTVEDEEDTFRLSILFVKEE